MQANLISTSVIEKEIEDLISTSKLYITKRKESELRNIKNIVGILRSQIDNIQARSGQDARLKDALIIKSLQKVISRFQETTQLLEKIKRGKPLYEEIDTSRMLDVLHATIKSIINYDERQNTIDRERLDSDLEFVESLEDQHKRVLMTFLMQDWHNLREVLALMKICEIYKDICEDLIELYSLIDIPE
jgi:hypothetical protein